MHQMQYGKSFLTSTDKSSNLKMETYSLANSMPLVLCKDKFFINIIWLFNVSFSFLLQAEALHRELMAKRKEVEYRFKAFVADVPTSFPYPRAKVLR